MTQPLTAEPRARGLHRGTTEERMHIDLPERLQASQADALLVDLKAAATRGEPLELDASKVQKVDTAGLQLLVSMSKSVPSWTWSGTSPALVEAARLLGLGPVLKLDGVTTP